MGSLQKWVIRIFCDRTSNYQNWTFFVFFQIDQICKFSGVQLWFSRATLYMDIQLESRPRSLYLIFLFWKTCPLNSKFPFFNSISYGWVFIYWLLFSLFFSSGSISRLIMCPSNSSDSLKGFLACSFSTYVSMKRSF